MVGGGYIAVEFAGIFSGLGSEVTLSYRGEQILRGFDDDVRRHLAGEMEKKGIRIALHSHIERIDRRPDGSLAVTFTGAHAALACDEVMFATGRRPQTENSV